uniref:Uncharacterized protein n=1 Tax=Cajanus cajan TaxID=3821 RepID=A0A151S9F4_CAJCA|nr:hypothetical protein KK1_026690 [Cajanus cajan]
MLLTTLPLSTLVISESISTHSLSSQIHHLEALARFAPTRFEARHVWHQSRHDALSLLRTRALFSLPSYLLSLAAALSAVASGKEGSKDDVVMVDPVEAKRLAAKQMERIKAKEKLKIRRQIEAINGAWAMIGLTAGLVIEGQTGKSILTQVKFGNVSFYMCLWHTLEIT